MDFTSDLTSFHGAIISADSIYNYTKIKSRGGNETKINDIKQHIIKFIEDKYSSKTDETNKSVFRKFALYLVLNADFLILEELVEVDGIGSVIWTVPTLPKCLLGELLWNPYMEQFTYEMIVFTYPRLSLQLAEILIENFRYCDPGNCFHKLKILVTSCYRFIYRLLFFNEGKGVSTEALQNFNSCLKYYYEPPNRRKLEMLNKDDKYKYIGDNLYAMLLTLCECFNEYTSLQMLKPSDYLEVYELTYKEESIDNSISEINLDLCTNNVIKSIIENCNVLLLDTCKELVMEVSVDIFCSWSEFEENGKSMQQKVGELCNKVYNKLLNISTASEHPLVNMLKQISCKPITCEEIINQTDCDTIVNNIQNNCDEKEQWLKALLKRDKLCDDLRIIEQISSNISVYNEIESYNLCNICMADLKNNPANKEEIILLLIKSFQQCSDDNLKIEMLKQHFVNSNFNNDLMSKEFESMSVEIFNKLTTLQNANLSNVFSLFLQCPKKVYIKIFELAVENKEQTQIMLNIIKQIEQFSNYYYVQDTEPCIISTSKEILEDNMDDDKIHNYVMFLCGLKCANIIPVTKLLLLIIMPSLHGAVINKKINCIYLQCMLLKDALTVNDLLEYKIPMLAMLGQVSDSVRWTINTFSGLAPSTLELLIQLLTSLINIESLEIKEKEKDWLKSKLRNINPLNMYYYRFLWNPPGDTFLEVVSGIQTSKNMDVELLTTRLSQLLCSTTLQEWSQLWDSLEVFSNERVFDIFHDALLMVAMAEKIYRTDTTWACLLYCFKNFSLVIRYNYLGNLLDENMALNIVNKLIIFENFVPDSKIKEFWNTLMPLLAYLAEKINENDNLKTKLTEVCNHNVKNKFFLDMLNSIFGKKFQNIC